MRTPRLSVSDVDRKVAFLRQTDGFEATRRGVEVIETHMSWVFLVGGDVWKLKKPVRKPYLDFSTLAARKRNCLEEIRLNRRLAPDVYLGLDPLTEDRDGRLRVAGPGRVVDWLVHMRRLPADRMLDRLIAARAVRTSDLAALARRLVSFYRSAAPIRISSGRYRRRLIDEVQLDRRLLCDPARGLPAARIERLATSTLRLIDGLGPVLAERVAAGRIVDGHGDLRPEHICLDGEPRIIDCLEFNRLLRQVDPVDELAFLALELSRLGAPAAGRTLLAVYRRGSGDRFPRGLVRLYTGFRALLRARLAIEHTGDHRVIAGGRWAARARAYLGLAEREMSWRGRATPAAR